MSARSLVPHFPAIRMKHILLGRSASFMVLLVCAAAMDAGVGCSQHAKRPATRETAPSTTQPAHAAATSQPIDPVVARIRDEGMNHSHAMETLDYLCNVIGPRLTA